jgi:predicted nucleotidyltransferase
MCNRKNSGRDFGLPEATLEKLRAVFAACPEVEEVVLFGSRANGAYKRGSDIDLALKGTGLTDERMDALTDAVDDMLLPYEVDLVLYGSLEHAALKEHIDRVGRSFYRRCAGPSYAAREKMPRLPSRND